MRQIDDRNIIELVKKDTNYQIKTTSASILRKFHAEMAEDRVKQEKAKKRRKYVFFGGTTAIGAVALTLFVAFVLNHETILGGDKPTVENPTMAISNVALKSELATFSCFHDGDLPSDQLNTISKPITRFAKVEATNPDGTVTPEVTPDKPNKPVTPETGKDTEGEENKDPEVIEPETPNTGDGETNPNKEPITEPVFQDLCNKFDTFTHSLHDLTSETVTQGFEGKFEKEGKEYKYLNKISYSNDTEPFAEMYFNNDKLVEGDKEEYEETYDALYFTNNQYFDLTINKEVEKKGGESEIEYSLVFIERENKNNIFKVKEEVEIEAGIEETYYAYSTFNSQDELLNDKFEQKLSFKVETDKGVKTVEMKAEVKDKVYKFKDAVFEKDKISFKANLESKDCEVKNIDITLVFNPNGKHTYTGEGYTYEK